MAGVEARQRRGGSESGKGSSGGCKRRSGGGSSMRARDSSSSSSSSSSGSGTTPQLAVGGIGAVALGSPMPTRCGRFVPSLELEERESERGGREGGSERQSDVCCARAHVHLHARMGERVGGDAVDADGDGDRLLVQMQQREREERQRREHQKRERMRRERRGRGGKAGGRGGAEEEVPGEKEREGVRKARLEQHLRELAKGAELLAVSTSLAGSQMSALGHTASHLLHVEVVDDVPHPGGHARVFPAR